MSKARKKLAEIETKLAAIGQSERQLSTDYGAARDRVEDLQAELEEAFEQGAIGLDGSTDEDIRKVHGILAKAKADADPELFERKRAGLNNAKRKLEGDLTRINVENSDEITAELVENGRALADDIRAWIEGKKAISLAALAQRWQALASEWLVFERALGLGHNHATRLDIPKFPLDVTGALDALPIPPSLAGGDPTIKSAA